MCGANAGQWRLPWQWGDGGEEAEVEKRKTPTFAWVGAQEGLGWALWCDFAFLFVVRRWIVDAHRRKLRVFVP